MDDFRAVADAVAADISAGRLRPGDRLPPQRRFARERGIAASTASRVYGELARRRLVVGEVGRGTYVRANQRETEVLSEPAAARVDLELNFSQLPDQPELMAAGLHGLLRPEVLAETLRPATVSGSAAARAAAADLLAGPGWAPSADQVLFTGNGRQALAAAVASLVEPGGRLGVEALTYPVVKGIAARLGVRLVPIETDEQGIRPDLLRSAGVRVVYLQPTLHNPLGTSMPTGRRRELAETLRELDVVAIEDTVNAFLRDDVMPVSALAPERVVLVDSLSKRLAAGLSVGFLVAPPDRVDRLASAVRSCGWAAPHFALEAAVRWITDGTVDRVQRAKRADAEARQRLAAERLAGFTVRRDPAAYHLWWELPEPWRADTFVAAAARRGIAVSPAAAFAVGTARAPVAVRLALASPPLPQLGTALDTLAALAAAGPPDYDLD